MNRKNSVIAVLLIAVLGLATYITIGKGDINTAWCNVNEKTNLVEGKILNVGKSSNANGDSLNFLIEQGSDKTEMLVHHNAKIDFKVGQNVKVVHTGIVQDSIPPQVTALCISVD